MYISPVFTTGRRVRTSPRGPTLREYRDAQLALADTLRLLDLMTEAEAYIFDLESGATLVPSQYGQGAL